MIKEFSKGILQKRQPLDDGILVNLHHASLLYKLLNCNEINCQKVNTHFIFRGYPRKQENVHSDSSITRIIIFYVQWTEKLQTKLKFRN